MKTTLQLSSILLVAGLASAQRSQTVLTASDVSVFAKSTSQAALDFVKKDQLVTEGLSLTASVQNARATTVVGVEHHHSGPHHPQNHFNITETGNAGQGGSTAGTSSSTDPKNISQGSHSFLVTMKGAPNTKTSLGIRWMGQAMGTSFVRVALDWNGDNQPDFQADHTDMMIHKDVDIVAGNDGFKILITTSGLAGGAMMGSGNYMGALTLILDDHDDCTFESYSAGCGPQMSGSFGWANQMHSLELRLDNGHRNAVGLLLFGNQKAEWHIMGNCWIRNNMTLMLPFLTDHNGHFEHTFMFGHQGQMSVYMQCATFMIGHHYMMNVMTSNAMHLQCGQHR